LLFGVVVAFALAVLRAAAEDLPVVLEEGLAPAVDAADVVDGEDAAALKEGVAPDGGAADAPAESETTGADVEPTGAGTASGPLALAALFRLATTAITSTSISTAEPSTRTRRIQ
jgi:hypothetical protein